MLALLVGAGMACAARSRFGSLPAGALNTSETHGVAAEICRDHLFNPTFTTARLPDGFRLIPASEAAAADPAVAGLLRANPALGRYALGSLCFLSVGKLIVNGAPVKARYPLPAAFWWASAEGPRHADMRGKTSWVQLGSWYSAVTEDRPAVVASDPMAEFVDLEVSPMGSDQWRLRLALPGEVVTADVTGSGPRVPSRAAQPGFMSVAMSGRAADEFAVFTYFGHHHRPAQGNWRAAGTGVFTDALAIAGEAATFGTIFQDGWTSRSGLYRFATRSTPLE